MRSEKSVEEAYNSIDHLENLRFDKLEILGVASWCAANNIVHAAVIIFPAHSATVHGIGKLDEDGVLLHDSLDMLSTDTNDTFVILVRYMERD